MYLCCCTIPLPPLYYYYYCTAGKDGTGLVAGHAYTLVAAKQTSKGDRLVKLRYPAYIYSTHT